MVFAFYGISSMVDYCHPISNVTKYHHKSPHIYTIARNMYILQYIHNGNNKCYSRKMSFLPKNRSGYTFQSTHSVSCHSQFFPKGIDVHFDKLNEKRQKNVRIQYIYLTHFPIFSGLFFLCIYDAFLFIRQI